MTPENRPPMLDYGTSRSPVLRFASVAAFWCGYLFASMVSPLLSDILDSWVVGGHPGEAWGKVKLCGLIAYGAAVVLAYCLWLRRWLPMRIRSSAAVVGVALGLAAAVPATFLPLILYWCGMRSHVG